MSSSKKPRSFNENFVVVQAMLLSLNKFNRNSYLIIIIEGLKFIRMNNYVQTAHLGKSKLTVVNTSKADFLPSSSTKISTNSSSINKLWLLRLIFVIPVGLASTVNCTLIFFKMHQSNCKLSKVRNIVVKQLGSFKHASIKAAVTNLWNICMIGGWNKLLEISKSVCINEMVLVQNLTFYHDVKNLPACFGVCINQFRFNISVSGLFSCHLQISNKVLPMVGLWSSRYYGHVVSWIICFYEWVDGFFNHSLLQLGLSQLGPGKEFICNCF